MNGFQQLESRVLLDGTLVINEILASNRNGVRDFDGDRPDWVELTNRSNEGVDTTVWHLTDDAENLRKWQLPSQHVGSGQTLLVFASGKNHAQAGTAPHANFRLRAAGEYLALVRPDGTVASELAPSFPPQFSDISYGQTEDGRWRYFDNPTPGAANGSQSFAGILATPSVSIERGLFADSFEIVVTAGDLGAGLVYTTDGRRPTRETGTWIRPAAADQIAQVSLSIEQTTTLRIAAYREDYFAPDVATHTYLFPQDVIFQDHQHALDRGLPDSWGDTQPDYGFDPDVVGTNDLFDGVYREQLVDALIAIPTLSLVMDQNDMFGDEGIYTNPLGRGINWERPTSVEWILPDHTSGFQIDAGIRIQGGGSRPHANTRKKSFRLAFRELYRDGELDYPLFGDGVADRFETLTLRANYNDGWQHQEAGKAPQYIRDQWNRVTQEAMGQLAVHGNWAHLYINGIYWGLYNPVERPDEAFNAAYLGGDEDDWDVLNHAGVAHGSADAWQALLTWARMVDTEDISQSNAAYQRLLGNNPDGSPQPQFETLLDVDNLIDYLIVNFYSSNTDWPTNNWYVARRQGPLSTGFKFYVWDAEKTLGNQSALGTNVTGAKQGVAEVYTHLRAHRDFRQRFADRVQQHLQPGGALHVDAARPDWDPDFADHNQPAARYEAIARQIELAIVAESARWGDQHTELPRTPADWNDIRQGLMTSYFPRRNAIFTNQLIAAQLFSEVTAPRWNHNSGTVPLGFELTTTPNGDVYYTLDGSDPRLADPTIDFVQLLSAEQPLRAWVPANDQLGKRWTRVDFDDTAWLTGQRGIGFERGQGYEGLFGLDIGPSMFHEQASAYLRVPFQVRQPDQLAALELLLQYDDGFVAYLNGIEVARDNAPDVVDWYSAATTNHRDSSAKRFQTFKISQFKQLLVPGDNVLAIHALNHGVDSNDFLIVPQLRAGTLTNVVTSIAAQPYLAPLHITEDSRVRARTLLGDEWSPLVEVNLTTAPLGDLDADRQLTVSDVDRFCALRHKEVRFLDLTRDGRVNQDDLEFLIDDLFGTSFGDTDLNGTFDLQDLQRAFEQGEYSDGTTGNSTWAEGDWNCDGEFDSADLILALSTGRFVGDMAP